MGLADLVYPDAKLAQAWLEENVGYTDLTYEAEAADQYGLTLARAGVAEQMLRDGAAVIFAQGAVPESWKKAELAGRAAKRGVWGKKDFLLSAARAFREGSGFHVVEGVVSRVYRAKDATYINFGADWHTDFSVRLQGRMRKAFDTIKPGDRVRVRGTLHEENGPMIEITHSSQVEVGY